MCASIMLENDSYILILLGYWGYEQWNLIVRVGSSGLGIIKKGKGLCGGQ